MYWYFGTEQGCAVRATGNSNKMALAQGININNMKILGFAFGNGLVALAGGILSQYQGYADINMGRGAIVIGLAAIIIGEALSDVFFKKGCSFYTRLAFVIVGGISFLLGFENSYSIVTSKLSSFSFKTFIAFSLIKNFFSSVPQCQ